MNKSSLCLSFSMSSEPKIKTQDPCLEILNLDYCKRYFFAVAPLNNGTGINPNSSYIRSISTYMDPMAPPLDLQAVFLPATTPCLLIKWTASCRNIPDPVGYKVRAHGSSNRKSKRNVLCMYIHSPHLVFYEAYSIPRIRRAKASGS